jgi:hypothetical protein
MRLKRSLITLLALCALAVPSFGGIVLGDDNGNPLPEGTQMTDGRDVYIIQHGLIHDMTKADIDEWLNTHHGNIRMYRLTHQTIVRAQVDARARATRRKSSEWIYAGGGGTWAFRDNKGVMHYFHLQEERYNQLTHDYDALLNGQWVHNPTAHGWVQLSDN